MFIKSTFMKIFVRIISTAKRFAERAKLVLIERVEGKASAWLRNTQVRLMKSSSVIYNWVYEGYTEWESFAGDYEKTVPKRNIGVVSECVSILWFEYESRIINEKNYIGFNITNIYYVLQIYIMKRPKLKTAAISSKMKFLRKCSPPLMKLQKQKWTLITFFSFSFESNDLFSKCEYS